ncbi:hypothetical protein [Moorena sp. SIO3H5]|uniref:hypothetical protein n=1 Tax=Moorena sp. SIO3H5 TaxID=2607834 RepID=UPI00344697DA
MIFKVLGLVSAQLYLLEKFFGGKGTEHLDGRGYYTKGNREQGVGSSQEGKGSGKREKIMCTSSVLETLYVIYSEYFCFFITPKTPKKKFLKTLDN